MATMFFVLAHSVMPGAQALPLLLPLENLAQLVIKNILSPLILHMDPLSRSQGIQGLLPNFHPGCLEVF